MIFSILPSSAFDLPRKFEPLFDKKYQECKKRDLVSWLKTNQEIEAEH